MAKLGVFDSGLGGFNVVAKLREKLDLDIVFLADHKNLPYGLKDDKQLKKILVNNMQWFLDQGIKQVLIACNTASNYIEYLRAEFPNLIIDSIIEITAKQFSDEDLVIFGTNKTVENKKYDEYLNKKHTYHALSDLAMLVEENNAYITKEYLNKHLKQYENTTNNYLLACTHYSLVMDEFKDLLTGNIYDSIASVLAYYQDYTGNNKLEVYSTGNIKVLTEQIHTIFDLEINVLPHLETYKMVVVSDNHGLTGVLVDVLEQHRDASVFIHCGDVELNEPLLDKFYVVNGNNDYFKQFDDHILLSIYKHKFYITHGHEYLRYHRHEKLYEKGKSLGVDIVFYGHEHIYQESLFDDIILLNPGSLYYNRDNNPPSYAEILIKKDKIEIIRHNLGR